MTAEVAGDRRTIELLFDFVSPNAYLIYHPLRALAAKYDAELQLTPVFLAGMHKLTGNAPPFIRDGEVKGKNAYAMLELGRFVARHGLTNFSMNPHFPFNSITLQRVLASASNADRLAIADVLLRAVWEEGMDASDKDAVRAALDAGGLDGAALLAATADGAVKQRVADATDHAAKRGAFGIPTMFVTTGGKPEMYFGKERLGQIEEQLRGE